MTKIRADIEKLELKQGDIVVIRARGLLPLRAYESMAKEFERGFKEWGYDCHVVICDDAMNITTIMRKEE